jgi:protein-tyrosine phosphatase
MPGTGPRDHNPAMHATRLLRLAGADNVRDLGGLPAGQGRRTATGRLFRGELLPVLMEQDVELLIREVGLRSVVDLRTRDEVRHEPGRWLEHEVAWVNCPFRLGTLAPVPGPGADFLAAYLGFLEGGPHAVLLAAETLMDPDHQPALFHCAAGKDRTGVLSALLLDVLGVPHDVIADDYALTSAALSRVFDRLAKVEPYRRTLADAVVADHEPHAATMSAFLDALHRRHGGGEAWLLAQGIAPSLLARYRETMVVPADVEGHWTH